jgi:hypothetical protein
MYRRVDELYMDRSYFASGDVCDLIICIRFRLLCMKREREGVSQNQGPVSQTAIDVNCVHLPAISPGKTLTSFANSVQPPFDYNRWQRVLANHARTIQEEDGVLLLKAM